MARKAKCGKSKKIKRGIACFSKKIPEDKRRISFDENNQPFGAMLTKFRSYYGMMVQHTFPIHIQMCKFEDTNFDNLWMETKTYWKIETDEPKAYMRQWAIKLGTNFRSRLVRNYVRKELNACDEYPFIDPTDWAVFVKEKLSKESKEKSKKASASNAKRKHVPRLGRGGWIALKRKMPIVWPKLQSTYKQLRYIQNERSKLYIVARAKKNKETNSFELDAEAIEEAGALYREELKMIADGTYSQNKEDPLVRVFGPEHGGRSRMVSAIIGYSKVHGGLFKNVNNDKDPITNVETRPTFAGSSSGSDERVNYPLIKSHTKCELLMNVGDKLVKVAYGMAWPSTPMVDDCTKVQVDGIVDIYKEFDVYNATKTSTVKFVEDLVHEIVLWPRYAVKLLNQETPSKSPTGRMNSSHGSRSHRSTSPRVVDDDTVMTSYYRPQEVDEMRGASPQLCDENIAPSSSHYNLVDEDSEDEFQMENQVLFDGGFVNMLLSVEKQTATNAPVSEPEPEVEPILELEPRITLILGLDNENWKDPELGPALRKVRNTKGLIRDIFDKLHRVVGTSNFICTSSPEGMYPKPVKNHIPYSELLKFLSRGWLDASVLHTFAMYFFVSRGSKCAFLDPVVINGKNCNRQKDAVVEHIKEVYKHHEEKRYFLAPFNTDDHWTLLIFEPSTASAFIVDSIKHGQNRGSFPIADLVATGFEREFNWTLINCNQQKDGWECGFMVIKHMREFVETIQHDFIKTLWDTEEITTHEEIEIMVVDLMNRWIKMVFGV